MDLEHERRLSEAEACSKSNTKRMDALEAEPGNRWKFVVEEIIYFVVAAVVGFAGL